MREIAHRSQKSPDEAFGLSSSDFSHPFSRYINVSQLFRAKLAYRLTDLTRSDKSSKHGLCSIPGDERSSR